MPFTFVFNGSFEDLYSLFQQLDGGAVRTTTGALRVNGRLLTIQSIKLAPATTDWKRARARRAQNSFPALSPRPPTCFPRARA